MIRDNEKAKKNRLRKFGLTMAVVLSLIGALLFWYDRPAWPYLLGVAGLFLVSGLLIPRILRPIEWLWMKLAYILNYVVTRIILIITFYLIVTPIGLIRQLFGKDPLKLKFDKNAESYWSDVDPKGPLSRPDKMY